MPPSALFSDSLLVLRQTQIYGYLRVFLAPDGFHARGAPSRSPAEDCFHARGAPSRSPAEGSVAPPCVVLPHRVVAPRRDHWEGLRSATGCGPTPSYQRIDPRSWIASSDPPPGCARRPTSSMELRFTPEVSLTPIRTA